MKFNRKQLEELTLEKIDEVNDEAGYRKYLEVPEMVEIIATIMEKKIKVFHDNDAELIRSLRAHIDTLDEEEDEYFKLKIITDKILREFPVGNISEHTIESLPERISYYLKELAEYTQRVEAWEKCADDLVDYAHGFVSHLSTWGKGYDRHDKDIKQAEDAIEMYTNLKNDTTEDVKALAQKRSDEPAWKSWNWPMYTPYTSKK
jgi:hypothetical protein